MQVNNTIYETLGDTWWREDAGFEIASLRHCINPVRYGYFRQQLLSSSLPGRCVLDVGCGGGFLAEEFARDGYEVIGIDPAARSIEAAREHAGRAGLAVRYQQGCGESLPFAAGSFAVVACCDVLEHVDDVNRVLGEVSRVLRPGGAFLFDTVNRTLKSWLVLIKLWQDWGLAGFPANAHVWEKFIRPTELSALLERRGIEVRELKGIGPRRNPLALMRAMAGIRAGRLRGAAVANAFAMCPTDDLGISYMGWAVKQP